MDERRIRACAGRCPRSSRAPATDCRRWRRSPRSSAATMNAASSGGSKRSAIVNIASSGRFRPEYKMLAAQPQQQHQTDQQRNERRATANARPGNVALVASRHETSRDLRLTRHAPARCRTRRPRKPARPRRCGRRTNRSRADPSAVNATRNCSHAADRDDRTGSSNNAANVPISDDLHGVAHRRRTQTAGEYTDRHQRHRSEHHADRD